MATSEKADGRGPRPQPHPLIRVLIADDHGVVREGLVAMIGRQEEMVVVAQAANGAEAVDLWRSHRPDITLLDLMNHTSGYPDFYPLDFLDRRMLRPVAFDDLLTRYAGGKLDFEPGSR